MHEKLASRGGWRSKSRLTKKRGIKRELWAVESSLRHNFRFLRLFILIEESCSPALWYQLMWPFPLFCPQRVYHISPSLSICSHPNTHIPNSLATVCLPSPLSFPMSAIPCSSSAVLLNEIMLMPLKTVPGTQLSAHKTWTPLFVPPAQPSKTFIILST